MAALVTGRTDVLDGAVGCWFIMSFVLRSLHRDDDANPPCYYDRSGPNLWLSPRAPTKHKHKLCHTLTMLCVAESSWVEEVGKKWSCTPSCSKSLVVTLSLFLLCASRHFSPSRLAPTCVLRLWRPRRLRSSCCCYRCCETRHNWKLTSETVESIENCPF